MPDKEDIESTKAPLIEHLTELRKRLIHCVLAFVVCMVVCFAFWEPIFTFLTDPICNALLTRGQDFLDFNCGGLLHRGFIKMKKALSCHS